MDKYIIISSCFRFWLIDFDKEETGFLFYFLDFGKDVGKKPGFWGTFLGYSSFLGSA
jgi:hypothetical protein